MNSHITDKFRKAFAELPADVQKQARQAYRLFMENPHHPSLRFNQSTQHVLSILCTLGWIIEPLAFAMEMTSFGTGLVPTSNMTN
jgi:hypothetical protein